MKYMKKIRNISNFYYINPNLPGDQVYLFIVQKEFMFENVIFLFVPKKIYSKKLSCKKRLNIHYSMVHQSKRLMNVTQIDD